MSDLKPLSPLKDIRSLMNYAVNPIQLFAGDQDNDGMNKLSTIVESDPEVQAAAEEERRKSRLRRGGTSTILTSQSNTSGRTILGQ